MSRSSCVLTEESSRCFGPYRRFVEPAKVDLELSSLWGEFYYTAIRCSHYEKGDCDRSISECKYSKFSQREMRENNFSRSSRLIRRLIPLDERKD